LAAVLDHDQLPYPVDSQVPDGRDHLPDNFWIRPIRTVKVTGGRL
jgi:hypothetical protein